MLKRWYTGNELVERWGIQPFELYEFMKNGLQAYTSYGKRIIDIKSCFVKAEQLSIESYEKIIRGKCPSAKALGLKGYIRPPTGPEIKQMAKMMFKGQPEFKKVPPPPIA